MAHFVRAIIHEKPSDVNRVVFGESLFYVGVTLTLI